MTIDFTPEQEDGLLFEYQSAEQRIDRFRKTASPQLSQTVGDLYRQNRDANPGVIVAAAQAVANGQMSMDQANKMLLDSQGLELESAKEEKKGGIEGWINAGLSKVRTASRWTLATLNFVPQSVVNLSSQVFNPNAPRDDEGWFISTDLGTLIENDEVAGSGFFLGGRAAQLQAERARRFRGEIDGKAWTPGRGFASLIVQPGSRAYNIISGVVDAATALATPSLPGVAAARGAAATQFAKVGEIGGLGIATRSAAGLLDAERAAIDPTKVRAWINSRGARQAIDKMAEFGLDKTTGAFDDAARLDEVRRAFPKVQDPQFWLDMVDAKSSDDIKNLLLDNLGKGVDDFDLSNRSVVEVMSQRFSKIERLAATMPGQHIVLQSGNSRDLAASVANMDNYLKLFAKKMPAKERQDLVLKYTRAAATRNNPLDAVEEINTATRRVMEELNVPAAAIDEIMTKMKSRIDLSVHGGLSNGGDSFVTTSTYEAVDGGLTSSPLNTPWAQSEIMRTLAITLPDPRKIRRINSDIDWLFRKGDKVNPENFADPRLPQSMIEAFQNELWRPLTLLTPGYVYRNMADSAFRLSFTPGLKGGVFHPLQWMMIATNKKFRGSVTGKNWTQYTEKEAKKLLKSGVAKTRAEADNIVAERVLRDGADEFIRSTRQTMRELYNIEGLQNQAYATRAWQPAQRGDAVRYSKGLRDQVSLLHDDPVFQRLAAGYDNFDDAVEKTIAYLRDTPAGRQYLQELQGIWKNREAIDRSSGILRNTTIEFIRADGTLNEANLTTFVNDALARLAHDTGNNSTLIRAIATGKMTNAAGEEIDIFLRNRIGQRSGYNDEWVKTVDGLVNNMGINLPKWVKYAEDIKTIDQASGAVQTRILGRRASEAVNKFFSEIYPRRSAYLMQSPAFRQFYYLKVGNLIDELNPQGITDLRNVLTQAAQEEGAIKGGQQLGQKWLANYVGDKDLAKKIIDKISNPGSARGNVTLDQMDKFAKGFALDSTQDLFYSAAERSNFADILRIVAPFGSAWAEVMSSWTKILAANPDAIRKVGVSVQGVRDADPDADGRGFFYKDPNTGEYVFNYPYSSRLGPLASFFGGTSALAGLALGGLPGGLIAGAAGVGVGAGLQATMDTPGIQLAAPAKTLSMGLNILPGLGPVAQIASSRILGKIPEADTVRKWLNPYGEPELTVVPSYAQKVWAAMQDPGNNRMLGDMKIETMRVLATTGNYDLTREDEKQRLEDDADSRARVLLFLRALGQFAGPTRPTPEFRVETFAGDKMSAELSKAFRDFQTADYDSAVENFLATFGEDAFLYIASKTRTTAGGLDASTEFGRFERENDDLFAQYPEIAGYFAPAGTNFDYQVYLRQLQTGKREAVPPSEQIDLAQEMVGKAIYRNVVRGIGGSPTAEQQEFLRGVREQLYARYPGFAKAPVTINRQDTQIALIEQAVFQPVLADNPIAEPTRQYMEARRLALEEANARGFQGLGGKAVADLRSWLRGIADSLIAGYPEFERIYDRVLFNEIDVDAGE
jgi:hypothetical protein